MTVQTIDFTTTRSLRVIQGQGALDRIADILDRQKGARAFVLTGNSVAKSTPLLDNLVATLGARHVGTNAGIGAHTPMPHLITAINDAQKAGADTIISLGGGSVIDAGKITAACLGLGITTAAGLRHHLAHQTGAPITNQPRHIAIPTTASAAEFTKVAGVLDPEAQFKRPLANASITPYAVVLDPDVVAFTPKTLWLSSAIRSVDHAVEALGGDLANAYTNALAQQALTLLFDALPRCHADANDPEAIAAIQQATWLAGTACTGAHTGLSHGIGYLFGATFGVPHGFCSCITLPHVMTWNGAAAQSSNAATARAAGHTGDIADLAAKGPDAVDRLIRGLTLPRALSEVTTASPQAILALAPQVLTLPHAPRNPRIPQTEEEAQSLLSLML